MDDFNLEWCEKNKVRWTKPGEPDYPARFVGRPYRPHYLFYWGQPVWNFKAPIISVVGHRSPSRAALEWLELELTQFAQQTRAIIVSGGARGVDQKAHQVALRQSVPTIAFLPSGLKNVYPSSLVEWIEPIVAGGGAVVSQFLPSQPMQKGYFHARNRLIAAVSPVTLIIEARRQSGTMLTARHALELNRSVGVVPSLPNEAGLGGLDLLADGAAVLIRDAMDLSVLARAAILIDAESQKNEIGHPCANGSGDLT